MQKNLKRALLLLGASATAAVFAATTPVDQLPVGSGAASSSVRSNVMLVMDDSGSMGSTGMPDATGDYFDVATEYGLRSSHCNGVFYDPSVVYALPQRHDGTSFAPATVGTTRDDGFFAFTGENSTSPVVQNRYTGATAVSFPAAAPAPGDVVSLNVTSCAVVAAARTAPAVGVHGTPLMAYVTTQVPTFLGANRIFGTFHSCSASQLKMTVTEVLGGAFSAPASAWRVAQVPASYEYLGTQPDLGFQYNAAGTPITTVPFFSECNQQANSTPALFRYTPATDLQNYANWYSYYRTRINAMKSALSISLGELKDPDRFRIGYTTINYSGTSNADNRYLDIGNYCAASGATTCALRQQLFEKVFSAIPNNSTGLRNGLSKAGLIYAGKLLTGARDPVQQSCQKNFALLSTDGYWNGGSGWPAADTGGYRIPPGACVDNACYALTGVGHQDSAASGDHPAYDPPHASVAIARPQLDANGVQNTLADVAMYYYKNRLRSAAFDNCTSGSTGEDLCVSPGTVPVNARDCNRFPHMNTFTLGLGVTGLLDPAGYLSADPAAPFNATDPAIDWHGLRGDTGWPLVNWPTPISGNIRNVDDLWHAAVNGRGEYYSAQNTQAIVNSLTKAFAAMNAQGGAAGAVGGSSQQLLPGASDAYLARFLPSEWTGDVLALAVDPTTGALISSPGDPASVCSASGSAAAPLWSAQQKLDAKLNVDPDAGTRKVYMAVSGSLGDFTVANLTSADFNPASLSQYSSFTPAEQAQATMTNLVSYLRGVGKDLLSSGQTCCEDRTGNDFRLFRERTHVLGDIVASSPYYVGKADVYYTDDGHENFRDNTTATRRRVVYAGANDGMMHAFDAGASGVGPGTGEEIWAFVPTAVLPNLRHLADFSYSANHRFYVNGGMNVGDIQPSPPSGAWKTLLVGGLGAGGRDYFALDVTNPDAPTLAWEFRSKNPSYADKLGNTFGNPLITKRKSDGKWVVLLSSGYNNESPGDGKGRLFVVEAASGVVLNEIVTTEPADASRSGISGIANWVDATMTDNSTQYVYGGDLAGNLWRFDINDASVVKVATFSNGGIEQAVTRRPELGEVKRSNGDKERWVFVATGKSLTEGDVNPSIIGGTALQRQSFYAVKDDWDDTTSPVYSGSFRDVSGVVPFDLNGSLATPKLDYAAVDENKKGWYFDFDLQNGERVSSDVLLQVGWLSFGTTRPNPAATACDSGLTGALYLLKYAPDAAGSTDTGTGTGTIITFEKPVAGVSLFMTSGSGANAGKPVAGVTLSDGSFKIIDDLNLPPGSLGEIVRRVSWRELVK